MSKFNAKFGNIPGIAFMVLGGMGTHWLLSKLFGPDGAYEAISAVVAIGLYALILTWTTRTEKRWAREDAESIIRAQLANRARQSNGAP